MNWIKANWVFVTAFASLSAAWGQQVLKIETLEQAVIQQAEANREQRVVREQVIRQDEQLKAIKESQRTQEHLLRELVRSQQVIERKVTK